MHSRWFIVPKVVEQTESGTHTHPKYADRFHGHSGILVDHGNTERYLVKFFGPPSSLNEIMGERDVHPYTPGMARRKMNDARGRPMSPGQMGRSFDVRP